MSPPWMPLYVADYLADTCHLTTLEHGAYMLLIMAYWRHGGLPDDDEKLARIARLSLEEWLNVRSTVVELFSNGWAHKRIDAELKKSIDKAEKASLAGKKSGYARKANKNVECVERTLSERYNETPMDGQPSQPQPYNTALLSASARTRENRDRLESECRRAGEHENSSSPGFLNLAPILGLLDQGADLESEILPAIRSKRTGRANSWSYYVPIIQDFRATRKAASSSPMPEARAPPAGKPDMYAALEESKRILAARQAAREGQTAQ